MILIDARHLDLIDPPAREWPMEHSDCASIKFRIAAWASRNGYVRVYRRRTEPLEIHTRKRAAR